MEAFGLTARALRYYEAEGLIETKRDRLNARWFDETARRRLEWISCLRQAGLSLGEVREVLTAEERNGGGRKCALEKLGRKQSHLQEQLAILRRVSAQIRSAGAPQLSDTPVRGCGRRLELSPDRCEPV